MKLYFISLELSGQQSVHLSLKPPNNPSSLILTVRASSWLIPSNGCKLRKFYKWIRDSFSLSYANIVVTNLAFGYYS